jgi:hypothetical protein
MVDWHSPEVVAQNGGVLPSAVCHWKIGAADACPSRGTSHVHELYARHVRDLRVCARKLIKILLKENYGSNITYSWEWACSLDFDLQFLLGRKRVRWPLVRCSRLNSRRPAHHSSFVQPDLLLGWAIFPSALSDWGVSCPSFPHATRFYSRHTRMFLNLLFSAVALNVKS